MTNHFGYCLIRRPMRSIDWLDDFQQQISSKSLEKVLMAYFLENKLAGEAIKIASESLYDRMTRWLNGEELSEKKQLLLTLYKYVIRSGSRCTPFGLFSCSALGNILSGSDNNLSDVGDAFTRVSLNIETFMMLSDAIEQSHLLRTKLPVFPNTSIYEANGKIRYVESAICGIKKNYFITGVEKTSTLVLVLEHCKSGSTVANLVDLLLTKGFPHDDSVRFIESLIENQIIQFDLKPTVTGLGYLRSLSAKLSTLKDAGHIVSVLLATYEMLENKFDLVALEEKTKQQLHKLGIGGFDKPMFKVDSFFFNSHLSVSSKIVEEIQETIGRLMVLNTNQLPPNLLGFKDNFSKMYGDREIPLAIALDDEIGIGYRMDRFHGNVHSPLIDDLNFGSDKPASTSLDTWQEQFILNKYLYSLSIGAEEINLVEEDIRELADHHRPDTSVNVASSFYIFGNILANSAADLDQGKFIFNLLACQGPSAVNMMSRFSLGIPGLDHKLQAIIKKEEEKHPDVVFAEVIHMHEAKAGNIMNRPNLHKYEIPYLGQSAVEEEFRITIDDLMVSIRNKQIVLRSKRLNKRIVPRLSNMHNYSNGLPIYRFLCELQQQDSNLRIAWDWGMLSQQQYLPRITYRNIILNRATWNINPKDFKGKTILEVRSLLIDLKVPARFVVSSADNELLIDVNILESMHLLIDIIKRDKTVRLKEFLSESSNCVVSNHGEQFVSEFVIPLRNNNASALIGFSKRELVNLHEHFSLGSEWFYLKIYQGEKVADSVLIDLIYPLVTKLMRNKIVDQFFFVRYRDPEPHLRLRFKGNPSKEFYLKVWHSVQKITNQYTFSGTITSLQIETYYREVERYGWQLTDICEELFDIDSRETLTFLAEQNIDETSRFFYAIKKIHLLLVQANYPFQSRHALLKKIKENFFDKLKGDAALRKKMNGKYSQYKSKFEEILEISGQDQGKKGNLLKQIMDGSRNSEELETIFSSLIHMSVNRIFTSKHHIYELLLSHCLFKYYDSIVARTKNLIH